MSDDPVRTCVLTDGGGLRFQEWFVRDRCAPVVRGLRLDGVERARPSPMAQQAYETAELVVIAPSNPLLSIDPILRVLAGCRPGGAVVAVSPLIGGRALKGPTVEVLRALGEEPTAAGIAAHYGGLASHLIIDVADADQARGLEDTGLRVHVAQTVMEDDAAAERLAAAVLNAVAGAREA